jgi:hypothetical protein
MEIIKTDKEEAETILHIAAMSNRGISQSIAIDRCFRDINLPPYFLTDRECKELSYETIYSFDEIRGKFQRKIK